LRAYLAVVMNNKKMVTTSYLDQQLAHFKKDLKSELVGEFGCPHYGCLTEVNLANQLATLKKDLKIDMRDSIRTLNEDYANTISECLSDIRDSLSENMLKENKILQGRVRTLEERITFLEHEREFYAMHHKGRRKKLEREVLDIVNDVVERRTSEIARSGEEEHDDDISPTSKKKEVLMKFANSKFCTDVLKNKLSKMSRKNS